MLSVVHTYSNKQAFLAKFQLNTPAHYRGKNLIASDDAVKLRQASVLIGIVGREHGLHLILTKRAQHLKHHPGQISFPGGKVEPEDKTMIDTAMREANEEIGISYHEIEVFGQLPTIPTVTGFAVTPILAWVSDTHTRTLDTNEVEHAFEIPMSYALDNRNWQKFTFRRHARQHKVMGLVYEDKLVWGMTAQILDSLSRHVR